VTDKLYVSFLRAGDKILNPDGTVTESFRNSWNALLLRTGNQVTNDVLGVINGVAQARAEAAAAASAASAASSQAAGAISGAAGSPSYYLTASVSDVSGTVATTGTATTSAISFTTNGGTGPYTWAYTKTEGDTFTVTSPAAASTTFTVHIAFVSSSKSAVYKVTATDSLAATATYSFGVSAWSEAGEGSGGIIP